MIGRAECFCSLITYAIGGWFCRKWLRGPIILESWSLRGTIGFADGEAKEHPAKRGEAESGMAECSHLHTEARTGSTLAHQSLRTISHGVVDLILPRRFLHVGPFHVSTRLFRPFGVRFGWVARLCTPFLTISSPHSSSH